MQRLARPRIHPDILRLQAFQLRNLFNQIVGEPVGVASALRRDRNHCFAGRSTRAQRILVRIDHYALMRELVFGRPSQHGLGHNAQGYGGGSGR
jgi:hypothetical protein